MSARRDPGAISALDNEDGLEQAFSTMKSSSKILIAIIAVVILAGTAFLIARHHGHRPHAQPPHAAGAYLRQKPIRLCRLRNAGSRLRIHAVGLPERRLRHGNVIRRPERSGRSEKTIWRKSKALQIRNAEGIHAIQRRANSCQENCERGQGGTQISDCRHPVAGAVALPPIA